MDPSSPVGGEAYKVLRLSKQCLTERYVISPEIFEVKVVPLGSGVVLWIEKRC